MDGAHDMGGVAWFGPVRPEPNEPVFHADMGAPRLRADAGDGDARRLEHRHVALCPRESSAARNISRKSYYQIWLAGLERLMLERGLIAPDEIEAGKALHPAKAGGEGADAGRRRRHAAPRRPDRTRRHTPCARSRPAIACAPR